MLTHRNLVSNALALRDLWRFADADILLHALPIYHTHGLFTATNTILMAGASMIFLPRFEPGLIFAHLRESNAMMGVPTFYTRLLSDLRLTREATAHMRIFISGSAPLLPEAHREWQARTGHAILERYGMTETNMITSNPYAAERRAGTVGFPLADVELRIADVESGALAPRGEIGVIEVRGPNVCKGYWRKPEQTAKAFRADGYFITGDLGRIDEDGYVQIVGRAKDLVISGGFNVYPREVEIEIDAIPGVLESAVIGIPHPDLGEAVAAIVVREPQAVIDEKEVIAMLRGRLAQFKLPRRIVFCDALPATQWEKCRRTCCATPTGICWCSARSVGGEKARCHPRFRRDDMRHSILDEHLLVSSVRNLRAHCDRLNGLADIAARRRESRDADVLVVQHEAEQRVRIPVEAGRPDFLIAAAHAAIGRGFACNSDTLIQVEIAVTADQLPGPDPLAEGWAGSGSMKAPSEGRYCLFSPVMTQLPCAYQPLKLSSG